MYSLYKMIQLGTDFICIYLKDHLCIYAVHINLHAVYILDMDDIDLDVDDIDRYRYTFSAIRMSYCMKREHSSLFPVKLQLRPLSTSLHCPHEEH